MSRRWTAVGLCFLSFGVSTGASQSIIVLFPAILGDLGGSRASLSVAPALAAATGSFGALLVGLLSERCDLRVLMPAGAVVAAAGFAACSRLTELWQLYLFYGVVAALGYSSLGATPTSIILARWFEHGRGTAIGIASSGYGAGVFVFMPVIQAVIRDRGWRSGYLVLAFALLALAPLLLLFLRSRPPQVSRGPVEPQPDAGARRRLAAVARRPRFWWTYAQFILGPLSTQAVIIHQAALMRNRGVGEMTSAWVVALFGLAVVGGMVASGAISDRVGRERSYTLGTLGLICGCLALLALRPGGGAAPAVAYALLFGFGFGTRPSMDAATAADIFRGPGFGRVYGLLGTALGLGSLAAPVLAGAIHDLTGSYDAALVFSMAAVSVATASIWMAAPRRGLEPA